MKEEMKRKVWRYYQDSGTVYENLQRIWEQIWCIDRLPNLSHVSVWDSGAHPTLRFARILAEHYKHVFCNDLFPPTNRIPSNMIYGECSTQDFVNMRLTQGNRMVDGVGEAGKVQCVTCISVLEHVEDKVGFCTALDSVPAPILLTLEYGEEMIALEELSVCLSCFRNHYISEMEECPVAAFNSAGNWKPLGIVLLPCGGA